MTEHDPEAPAIRSRTIYHMLLDDGPEERDLLIEHVYIPEGEAGNCEHCGSPARDPGLVGLIVGGESALLTAEEALTVANRLTRAANLVLESEEDIPDIEREAARFAPAGREGEVS
jgi:hypothetical protein